MRKSLLTIAMFATVSGFAQSVQCSGTTKANTQCKQTVTNGTLCHHHDPNYIVKVEVATAICSGTTKANKPCKVKTKHTSGKCHHHRPKTNYYID